MPRKPRTIRYSDEEWKRAARRASEHNLRRSTYIRKASAGDLDPSTERGKSPILARLFSVATRLKQLRIRFDEAAEKEGGLEQFEHDSVALGSVLDEAKGALEDLGAYARSEAGEKGGVAERKARFDPSEEASR